MVKGRTGAKLLRAIQLGVVRVVDLFLFIPVVLIGIPLWILPWDAAAKVARFYGRCAFLVWFPARRTALINLRRAGGMDLSFQQASSLTRQVFCNLAQSLAEGLQFARRFKGGQEGWEDLYKVREPDLEERIHADPRPKVFVTGHLGSWEVALLIALAKAEGKGAAVVRRVDNPLLNSLVRWIRLTSDSQWIEKRGAVTDCIRCLERGDSVALLLDENGGRKGVFVSFFSRPASTHKLAALLSLITGSPVVIGAALRPSSGRVFDYRLAVLEPSHYGSGPRAVRGLTQDIVGVWEEWVREHPEQWRWIHWRWRTRPDRTEERYGRHELKECYGSEARWTRFLGQIGRSESGSIRQDSHQPIRDP